MSHRIPHVSFVTTAAGGMQFNGTLQRWICLEGRRATAVITARPAWMFGRVRRRYWGWRRMPNGERIDSDDSKSGRISDRQIEPGGRYHSATLLL